MRKLITLFIFCSLSLGAFSETIHVDANGAGDYPTIQAAVDDANNGDIIVLYPGTYTGDGNRDVNFIGKAITIKSQSGPDDCIIDCNGTSEENHRGFYFITDEDSDSVLQGLTIANAYAVVECEGGAGIYIEDASPTIQDCIVTGNYCELDPCSVCFCYGSGIYIGPNSAPLISNCTISYNSIGEWGCGAGIYCGSEMQATIKNCLIADNQAAGTIGFGGGIYYDFYSGYSLTNCTIVNNIATVEGGGIFIDAPLLSPLNYIANTIIWGNIPEQISIYDANDANNLRIFSSDIDEDLLSLGNINTDPYFVDIDGGNYRLKRNSPCIDTASNDYVSGDSPQDLDGRDRIVDGDCNDTEIVDMGAYEFSYASIGDFSGDYGVDFVDFSTLASTWLLDEQQAGYDPNCDIAIPYDNVIDGKDLEVFIDNWLIGTMEPSTEDPNEPGEPNEPNEPGGPGSNIGYPNLTVPYPNMNIPYPGLSVGHPGFGIGYPNMSITR